ncbi:MAG: DUF881 domain-containing protein [Heliobacteriaceae bacterium]|nr:DUF881 domain-containing protein [Heliobacteriaceae bacterium]MDD4587884.1 DUF881 domain-containing protein [Heliobacteriaceae bacterium]
MKMQWKKWQVALTIVALALGILLVTQFNTATELAKGRTELVERQKSLADLLERAEVEKSDLEKEVAFLKAQVAKYEQVAKGAVGPGISQEIDRLRILTGYYPVEGAGIRIVLDDHQAPNSPVNIIDLMEIMNILRYSGAEAIAINGQRLVGNSEVYVSGKNILINKTPISSDKDHVFVIEAIGPPDQMAQVLQVTDGRIISLKESKIDVKITQHNKISIPDYSGTPTFNYARLLPDNPD